MNRPADNTSPDAQREGSSMTDPTDTVLIGMDDRVLFRLLEGRRPLVYPDTVTRVSYEIGINVLHTGTVWAVGYAGDAEAFELDDGTIIAVDDVDAVSLVVTPSEPS